MSQDVVSLTSDLVFKSGKEEYYKYECLILSIQDDLQFQLKVINDGGYFGSCEGSREEKVREWNEKIKKLADIRDELRVLYTEQGKACELISTVNEDLKKEHLDEDIRSYLQECVVLAKKYIKLSDERIRELIIRLEKLV